MIPERSCEWCHKNFEPQRNVQRFCGVACSSTFRRRTAPQEIVGCHICGSFFNRQVGAPGRQRIYCGKTCARQARKLQARDRAQTLVHMNCVACGQPLSGSHNARRKYCSASCRKLRRAPTECRLCGRTIKDNGNAVYCSGCRYAASAKKDRQLRGAYGIGLQEVEQMLTEQMNRCAICDSYLGQSVVGNRRLNVDHIHGHCKAGCPECVRKILCVNCNVLVGLARDSPQVLQKAAQYVSTFTVVAKGGK